MVAMEDRNGSDCPRNACLVKRHTHMGTVAACGAGPRNRPGNLETVPSALQPRRNQPIVPLTTAASNSLDPILLVSPLWRAYPAARKGRGAASRLDTERVAHLGMELRNVTMARGMQLGFSGVYP